MRPGPHPEGLPGRLGADARRNRGRAARGWLSWGPRSGASPRSRCAASTACGSSEGPRSGWPPRSGPLESRSRCAPAILFRWPSSVGQLSAFSDPAA
eukprot:9290485-Pyramimonas_sp.AAC.1